MTTVYNFPVFEGAQVVFRRLMAVCCMLLPHNPYRFSQHYKRHIFEPFFTSELWFFWISPIFELQFCLDYMCTVHHWKHFSSTVSVCFIGQVWYLNLQQSPVEAINKAGCVWNHMSHLGQNAQLLYLDIQIRLFMRGLGGGGVNSGSTKKPLLSRVL